MAELPLPIIGALIGALFGVAGVLFGTIGTNYLARRREDRSYLRAARIQLCSDYLVEMAKFDTLLRAVGKSAETTPSNQARSHPDPYWNYFVDYRKEWEER